MAVAPVPLMSEDQLKAFLEKVKTDTELKEELKGAADVNAVVAIAKAAGFMISADEIKTAKSAPQELSDDELESLSGGDQYFNAPSQNFLDPRCNA